ncbi:lytic transglycosylase domain-containing protein [Escherichia coli]|nr:lytic transglycosylase domain-containing protein [Escherichia coli]
MPNLSIIGSLSACLINASVANNIDPKLLTAIAVVEGGKPGLVSVNKNGTHDLGVMQINTGAWLKTISNTFFNGDNNQAYIRLKNDGCFNIAVGAWILSYSIRNENGDVWEGVGRYHSRTPKYKYRYIRKVKYIYAKNGGYKSK